MQSAESKQWDAIVIGSGIGGMAAAAALSKVGHEVLVLEQYQTLGGLTHSFSIGGFTWDAGIHYLSGIATGDPMRDLLDWLADTPIEFTSMGPIYDNLHIGDAEPLALSRPFEAQERDLKDRFPDEAESIEAWTLALREAREAINKIIPTRAMPELFGNVVQWWHRRAIDRWCRRTTQEVIDEITDNPELAAVFAAQWGDHGGRPSKASFAMHALISASYLESGSWYPVGGGAAFAEHILPTIAAGGGEARANSRVETLLFEHDRVVGVRTADGEELRADAVISDIGARETVDHLLPPDREHQEWVDEIRSLSSSIAHFSLFLGFEGDVEDAGATRSNHWIYPTGEVDVVWTDAPDNPPPAAFVSFASVKDADHDPGASQKHAGEMGGHGPGRARRGLPVVQGPGRGDDVRAVRGVLSGAGRARRLQKPLDAPDDRGDHGAPPWRLLRPGRHARAGHERSAAGQDPCTGPLPLRSGRREPRDSRRAVGRRARRGQRGPEAVQAVARIENKGHDMRDFKMVGVEETPYLQVEGS